MRFSGTTGALSHPPGGKAAPYTGKRQCGNAVRMVAPEHVEQIVRMLGEYFGRAEAEYAWLRTDYGADEPWGLSAIRVN